MLKFNLSLLFLLCSFSAICQQNSQVNYQKEYFTEELGFPADSIANPTIYNTVIDWLSTKYHYGGKNKKGIDCSSFVKAVYDSAYHLSLSGSSGAIYGKDIIPIAKEQLKEGDLVFFKIRRKRISHVGIYLDHNKFAHATRAAGVIVSDLDEPYYKRYFYHAGRHKVIAQADSNHAAIANLHPQPSTNSTKD